MYLEFCIWFLLFLRERNTREEIQCKFEGLLKEVSTEVVLESHVQPYVPTCQIAPHVSLSTSEHTLNSLQSQGLGYYGLEGQVSADGSR